MNPDRVTEIEERHDRSVTCGFHSDVRELVAALRQAQAERDHATRAALHAMNQRDEQRRMKEGNITALDTALAERDALQARLDAVREVTDMAPEYYNMIRTALGDTE